MPINGERSSLSNSALTSIRAHADSVAVQPPSDDPLAGDPELRQQLAVMFLRDCPRLLSEIRAAMTRLDGGALKVAAHTLKGSAGIFQVQPAFDAAFRMECIGKNCDWEHAEEAWATVNEEMSRLSATLSNLTRSASTSD